MLTVVAFDDIEIDQCASLISTTTSTLTTTTSTLTTATSESTTTTSKSTSARFVSTVTSTTTIKNKAPNLYSLNSYNLIIHYFFAQIFRQFL